MSLCPYCEEELEFKVALKSTVIESKILKEYIDSLSDKQEKKKALIRFRDTLRYSKNVSNLPILCFSCQNCGKVINVEIASKDNLSFR